VSRGRIRAIAAVLAVLVAFGIGVVAGAGGLFGVRPPMLTGDGVVGDRVVSLSAGGTTYGAKDSIAWRDSTGAVHSSGWPDCLMTLGEVHGVKFDGAVVWHQAVGISTILLVDCGP
jgi:hypothetical protein